ncbi:MAG: DM13 domain-containing protein [Xenococcaceae cyanobacterium]
MKLNQLAALGVACAVVLGSVGIALTNSSAALADYSSEHSSPSTAAREILRSGTFVTTEQDHPTTGTGRIVNENGQRYVEFDSAFRTASGPDVQVILHRSDVVPVKVSEPDYVTLAPLKSFNGAQRYEIPASLNLDEFKSVAIWCRKFNVTFGYASL